MEMAIIMLFGNVKDKKTFSTMSFMKSKFCNQSITNLDVVVWMFAHQFYMMKIFHSTQQLVNGPKKNQLWQTLAS